MKLLHESRERKWYLVKEWITEAGLPARIQQCKWALNDPESEVFKEIKAKYPTYETSLHDHYTGYVQIPEGNTKKYYDSQEIDVHGGVTFENSIEGAEGRWVGFDLAHLGDENKLDPEAYATAECESLAKQIAEIKPE